MRWSLKRYDCPSAIFIRAPKATLPLEPKQTLRADTVVALCLLSARLVAHCCRSKRRSARSQASQEVNGAWGLPATDGLFQRLKAWLLDFGR